MLRMARLHRGTKEARVGGQGLKNGGTGQMTMREGQGGGNM